MLAEIDDLQGMAADQVLPADFTGIHDRLPG